MREPITRAGEWIRKSIRAGFRLKNRYLDLVCVPKENHKNLVIKQLLVTTIKPVSGAESLFFSGVTME